MRAEVAAVGVELADDVERWVAALGAWQKAGDLRDREVERVRRRLLVATGGLGVERWRQACDRQRFRTVEDARSKARAVRARAAVEAALADLRRTAGEHDAAVEAASGALALRSRRVLAYGHLGVTLTGLSRGELERLARSCLKADG